MDGRGTSRLRVAAHLAPATIGWIYFAWAAWDCDWDAGHSLWVERLYPVQTLVAIHAFAGGLWAFWLPARRVHRLVLVLVSFLATLLLLVNQIYFAHQFEARVPGRSMPSSHATASWSACGGGAGSNAATRPITAGCSTHRIVVRCWPTSMRDPSSLAMLAMSRTGRFAIAGCVLLALVLGVVVLRIHALFWAWFRELDERVRRIVGLVLVVGVAYELPKFILWVVRGVWR